MASSIRAIRGATTVDADQPDLITERVVALLTTIIERNGLDDDAIVSPLRAGDRDKFSHPTKTESPGFKTMKGS